MPDRDERPLLRGRSLISHTVPIIKNEPLTTAEIERGIKIVSDAFPELEGKQPRTTPWIPATEGVPSHRGMYAIYPVEKDSAPAQRFILIDLTDRKILTDRTVQLPPVSPSSMNPQQPTPA